ncbi:T9SS type A sorting domain-containing protein [Hymenobacter rubripertinctus]|uniref:T9SS C-terminal target domain-containing protein n=1 Tax=Hymenobacter rubripertinctus TaxID=2029981 RepID=A0A418QNG1_9BACT|nr:T9SS type A sorting domain-containing protein [Hymenobacter rubripertinctus]RIY06694.1 T9SS C-terminal target domain-containing protein [Hymenobacter rubripertinctus]
MKTFSFPALLLAALLLAAAPASLAQTTTPAPTTASGRTAHHEARAYVREQVLPAVRQQRQQLETQLTAADRAQLAIYRSQLREIRDKGQALRQSWRAAAGTPAPPTGSRPTLTEAQQQQVRQLRTETKGILASVRELAQQYAPNISRLTAVLEPRQQKWTADLHAIIGRAGGPAETAAHAGRHQRRGGPIGRLLRPTAFLLLDPIAPAPTVRAQSRVYPNPATATTQLAYEVTKAGPVTVEVLDSRGNTLRTVAQNGQQDKGPHTLAVDVADLPAGTYFFKIMTRAGAETRRFVKE